ncbi:hypothetical protein AAG570_013877 [Ranatra chinensis]|uniref:Gustatory receptor n=1 Tax=Ranatra chinensis TaxID=642074 RepID=A0ABD0YDH4_9HEMI
MGDTDWPKDEATWGNVRDAANDAFFLSKVFGMFPYGGDLNLNLKLLSYSLFLVLATVGLGAYNLIQVNNGMKDAFVGRVEFLTLSLSVFAGFVTSVTTGRKLKDLLLEYERARSGLHPLGLSKVYDTKDVKLAACCSLALLTTAGLADLIMTVTLKGPCSNYIAWSVFFYLGWAMQDCSLRQFTTILHYLNDDFAGLKRYMKDTNWSLDLSKVETVTSAHDSLSKFCVKLNSFYSVQLFFILKNNIVILIISAFLLERANVLVELAGIPFIVTGTIRSLLYIFQLWHVCSSCQTVSNEANDFKLELYEVAKNDYKNGLPHNFEQKYFKIVTEYCYALELGLRNEEDAHEDSEETED